MLNDFFRDKVTLYSSWLDWEESVLDWWDSWSDFGNSTDCRLERKIWVHDCLGWWLDSTPVFGFGSSKWVSQCLIAGRRPSSWLFFQCSICLCLLNTEGVNRKLAIMLDFMVMWVNYTHDNLKSFLKKFLISVKWEVHVSSLGGPPGLSSAKIYLWWTLKWQLKGDFN